MHAEMLSCAARLGYADGWAYEECEIPEGSMHDADFLPLEIRAEAVRILRAGRRVPEEVLGPAEMRSVLAAYENQ